MVEVDLGPGVRAGFTTRSGGVSHAPWDELNLGLTVGDDPEHVRTNRALVEAWAGAPVAYARQVHGRGVLLLRRPSPGAGQAGVPAPIGEADALVATTAGVAVGVTVADCVPVLLADPTAGVVAAVHAGRAGLLAGVLQAALSAMADAGATQVRAVVGPCIAGRSYEVPAGLRDEVAAVVPATAATTAWGTPALDLAAGVLAVLAAHGVPRAGRLERDTFTDRSLFSYRRAAAAGTVTGRFAGVVRLLP